jgi:type II secretion system protein J
MIVPSHNTPRRPSSSISRASLLRRRGFTLIEVLAATTMFAILIVAVFSVFYAALGMRERAHAAFESDLPRAYVAEIIRRDLAGTIVPTGLMAGEFIGETNNSRNMRSDQLEFHTASGIVNDTDPWGDIQKVEYYLEQPENQTVQANEDSKDLVRAVTRNLLASTTQEPEAQRLLNNVQSLNITYYDGEDWQDSWDSTTEENVAPEAIRVAIAFLPTEAGERQPDPIDLVVPVVAQAPASTEEQSTTASGPTPTGSGQNNTQGPGGGR